MKYSGDENGIDALAAVWATRLDERELSPRQAQELNAWMAADRRHAGALLRARSALALMDRGRALSGVFPDRSRENRRRRLFLQAAGWSALAVGVGQAARLLYAQNRYSTSLGEVRRIPLDDGSLAVINSDSTLTADISRARRDFQLARGETWLQVARDPQRPLVVAAGRIRIRALGTAFSVRLRRGGVNVAVSEGIIEAWALGNEARKVQLRAGAGAFIAESGLPVPLVDSMPAVNRMLAWRDNLINLQGESLADAVDEFNRYNQQKLVVDDGELAQATLVGVFRTTEPEAFARAVVSSFGAEMAVDGATIRLWRKRPL